MSESKVMIQLYGGPSDGTILERDSEMPLPKTIDVPAVPVSVGVQSLANGYACHVYEQETILGLPVKTVYADGRRYYRYRFARTAH